MRKLLATSALAGLIIAGTAVLAHVAVNPSESGPSMSNSTTPTTTTTNPPRSGGGY
jgi:hypothetical protein